MGACMRAHVCSMIVGGACGFLGVGGFGFKRLPPYIRHATRVRNDQLAVRAFTHSPLIPFSHSLSLSLSPSRFLPRRCTLLPSPSLSLTLSLLFFPPFFFPTTTDPRSATQPTRNRACVHVRYRVLVSKYFCCMPLLSLSPLAPFPSPPPAPCFHFPRRDAFFSRFL